MKLSIIVPCFNEEEAIPIFYRCIFQEIQKIKVTYKTLDYEIIFIDDGSCDSSLEQIKQLRNKDNKVVYVSFSRNFGKESGLYAGLQKSSGDYIVTMDVDLQDPPGLLLEMLDAIIQEGYDSAATRRVNRKGEPPIRSFFARQFYKVINMVSNTEIVDGARDYRIMTRKMVDAIISIKERNRFTKGIYGWIGFKTKWIEFENVERVAGETKWNFWKLFSYAMEGIIAYSTFPLSLVMFLGILLSAVAILAIVFVVVRKLMFGDPTSGWASMICVILLLGGLQLFSIGIISQYLAKTYLEAKQRPLYIVREESK